jgi:D-alanyl-D-alanine carboxypeptidase/D-alanyl-D-alanine-endopeptidase (penicillin-binding protein 4)
MRSSIGAALAALVVAVPTVAHAAAAPGPVTPSDAPAAPPGAVLAPITPGTGPQPSRLGLGVALAKLLANAALGPSVGLSVVDVATGQELLSLGSSTPITPASTTKVLTAAAALATLGPDAHLHTTVVRLPDTAPTTSPTPNATATSAPSAAPTPTIVLVGGGDPLLTSLPTGSNKIPAYPPRAHLDDLAQQTAKSLAADGVHVVHLQFDSSFFSGPAASPQWERGYTGDVVGPVMGLSADQGRIAPLDGGRVNDPAGHTAAMFVDELRKADIEVVGKPTEATAPKGLPTIADVSSAPISAELEQMLVFSDNDIAEAMARQVAVHDGLPGTFENGAAAVHDEVAKLGVDMTGVTTYDGSGLSRHDRIPPRVLAQTLAMAATSPNDALRVLIAALAPAGVSGTLQLHFYDAKSQAARGLLRAKSGSLQGVTSLTGILPDADGRLLSFDMAADNVAGGYGRDARIAIERVAAALIACGCR